MTITNMYPSARRPHYGTFVKGQVEAMRTLGIKNDVVADHGEGRSAVSVTVKYFRIFISAIVSVLRRRYDIVHAHYLSPTGVIGLVAARLCGARLLVTAHRGDVYDIASKGWLQREATRQVIKHADSIVAVSRDLKEYIVTNFNVTATKISIIHMGAECNELIAIDKRIARGRLTCDRDLVLIAFVGADTARKGLLDVLDAVDSMSPWINDRAIVHVIGNVLQGRAIPRCVRMLGLRPHSQVRDTLAAADIFVLPSYCEGTPVAALEAMAAGCACIISRAGGMRELGVDGEDVLFVDAGDAEGIRRALEKLITDVEMRRRLGAQARRAAAKHDKLRTAEMLMRVYKQMAQGSDVNEGRSVNRGRMA